MTPRLKLSTTGRLTLLRPATCPLSRDQALALVLAHYGSRLAFACRWQLNYGDVSQALRPNENGHLRGGAVARVRQLLGLRSEPSTFAQKLAEASARRKARRAAIRFSQEPKA